MGGVGKGVRTTARRHGAVNLQPLKTEGPPTAGFSSRTCELDQARQTGLPPGPAPCEELRTLPSEDEHAYIILPNSAAAPDRLARSRSPGSWAPDSIIAGEPEPCPVLFCLRSRLREHGPEFAFLSPGLSGICSLESHHQPPPAPRNGENTGAPENLSSALGAPHLPLGK